MAHIDPAELASVATDIKSSLCLDPEPSTASSMPNLDPAEVASFAAHLKSSKYILALVGAGLSASSGLPTFRGPGGLWRKYDATLLATPKAFRDQPRLVWIFYNNRRHMALNAKPNKGHYALAELARKKEGFLTLSQNVDGLHVRANHPNDQLFQLHGSLFDFRCQRWYPREECDYHEKNNFMDPVAPSLVLPPGQEHLDLSDPQTALPPAPDLDDIPRCPRCSRGIVRPGIVWFGENLPEDVLGKIDEFLNTTPKIDLMMVIGTGATVSPASSYVRMAMRKGARVAVINTNKNDVPWGRLREGEDWMFEGDAAEILPVILREEIGELKVPEEGEEKGEEVKKEIKE